jgi:hypothetical protein
VVLLIGAGAYLMLAGNGFDLPFSFGSSDNEETTASEEEQPSEEEPVKTEVSITE